MIAGIGIDLCEISRMEKLLEGDHFLARYFSPGEQVYIRGRGKAGAQSMAGIYAAKEALVKALGCGIVTADLSAVEVTHDKYGKPAYVLEGEYARLAEDKRISSFHLSITHDGGMAAAVCAAERKE